VLHLCAQVDVESGAVPIGISEPDGYGTVNALGGWEGVRIQETSLGVDHFY
jgi:hypothetical protein